MPCWVVEMDDAAAFMKLVRSNSQGELTPLERGMHALKSGMGVREYGRSIGRDRALVVRERKAAEVLTQVNTVVSELAEKTKHLAELHATPSWLWPALVGHVSDGNMPPATLDQVGLTRKQSSDYQRKADVGDRVILGAVAQAGAKGRAARGTLAPGRTEPRGPRGMIASKQTFTGMRLVLDGCTFEGCAFRGCILVYTGALPVVLVGNSYDAGCRWELSGPARRTLEFLAHLHRSGAERLVENTFDQIRGKPPAGGRLM